MTVFRRHRTAFLRWCGRQVVYTLAYIWRRLLFRTTFIAVTGSLGKTTTKECIGAILSAHFPTAKTVRNQNDRSGIPRTIFRVRPWHRFAVIEVGTDRPGSMVRYARLVKPHLAVVLTVAGTHTKSFSTLDEAAAEKAKIVEALRRGGLAILNAEDPRVREMGANARCTGPEEQIWRDGRKGKIVARTRSANSALLNKQPN